MGDDIYMNYGVSSLSDVFEHTKMFYYTYGGRLFSVVSQYLFSGVLGNNRIWFDIVNTLFFVLWILVCGKLISDSKQKFVFCVLLFVLLFWFLCPAPDQTLFWTAASTTYLWANTLAFVFLLFFQKYKDDNFSIVGKLGLFIMSIFAATEYITCASICGTLVVYYGFHIKRFKGNAIPFVTGFVIGSMFCMFAPGSVGRAGLGKETSFFDIIQCNIHYVLQNPVQEIVTYKVLWIFLVVFVLGWISNKAAVKAWMKNNSILLLSLGWSVIAFSVVFRPAPRALFFTESLSLVLFLKFLFDNYGFIKIRFIDEFLTRNLSVVRSVMMILLFAMFIVDSAFAVVETKRQSNNNDVLMKEIIDSRGFFAWQEIISFHRMAYAPKTHSLANKALADKYGLDSIYDCPFFCIGKYFTLENTYYVELNNNYNNIFKKEVRLIVRIENEQLQWSRNPVVFTINYTRPRKWYKSWLDKKRNYQYDRTVVVERDQPDVCFNDYCYYIIWFKRENAKNLKSVRYEFK